MKLTIHFQTLLLFMFLTGSLLNAQDYNRTTYSNDWELGINAGFAFQEGDIKIAPGWGVGLTLGKTLYHRDGGFIDLGLRGRLLYTQTYGRDVVRSTGIANNSVFNGTRAEALDYLTDPGYLYQNHKSHIGELSLEGVLTFNRLRERTGVILSLYGGLGIDAYQTNTDQLDLLGDRYDYASIDPAARPGAVRSELEFLRDAEYETLAEGYDDGVRVSFMPSLGVELGYQVDPRFSLGLGHRWTYALHDQLEGQQWTNDNVLTSQNDKYHYTNVWFRWKVKGAESRYDDPVGQVDDPVAPILPGPIVRITNPANDPFQTSQNRVRVFANIEHVDNRGGVTVSLNNNRISDFTFNPNNNQVEFSAFLNPGRNIVEVTGSNSVGTASDRIRIDYSEPIIEDPIGPVGPPPVEERIRPNVQITNPSNDPFTTYENRVNIEARIDHVDSKGDIYFTVNGNSFYNFNFNQNNGRLTANIDLQNGNNIVAISASNIVGSDQDQTTIRLEQRINPPNVQFTNPSNNSVETNTNTYNVRARLTNVENRNNVSFRVNGNNINNFDYNPSSGQFSASINLIEGNNSLTISGSNQAGSDQDQATILYARPIDPTYPPTVQFTNPSNSSVETSSNTYTVRARVTNVSNRNGINFRLNGRTINNFDYNTQTGQFSVSVNLVTGNNSLSILASNNDGQDSDNANIVYQVAGQAPSVSIIKPSANPYNSETERTNILASVLGVDSRNQIRVELNGQNVSNFEYTLGTGTLSFFANLNPGVNNVLIRATNDFGSDDDSRAINFNAPLPRPTVKFTYPDQNPYSISKSTITVRADITHVDQRSGVQFRLNGQTSNSFSFNPSSGAFSANLTLVEGQNVAEITVTNPSGSDSDSRTILFDLPKPAPTVSITRPQSNPLETTNEVTGIRARITGVNSKGQISFRVNGRVFTNFTYNAGNQVLSAQVSVPVGSNSIVISADNGNGTAEDSRTIIRKEVPKNPPTVSIVNPANDPHTTSLETVKIQARITGIDNRNQASVRLNGNTISNFNYSNEQGLLVVNITVRPGRNTLIVSATNDGGTDSDQVQIQYNKPTPPPIVNITTPSSDPFILIQDQTSVQANIQHVSSRSDITFTVDGRTISQYNFNSKTGKLTAQVSLTPGNNFVEISATNNSGQDSDNTMIIFRPEPKPEVDITTPRTNPYTTTNSTENVRASLKHVANSNQIKITNNKRSITGFLYNSATGLLNFNVNLQEGSNNIIITARTNAGSASDNTTIVYQRPVSPPTVTVVSPNEKFVETNQGNFSLQANLTNIDNKNQITFTVGGQSKPFSYNASTGRLTANITLTPGNNVVVISANNSAGSDSKQVVIAYAPPPPGGQGNDPLSSGDNGQNQAPTSPPTVNFTAGTTAFSSSKTYNVQANVGAIQNTSELTLRVNGKNTSGVSLNSKSGTVTKSVQLKEGVNKIRLDAKNSKGEKSKNLTVIYTAERNAPKVFWVSPGNKSTRNGNPNLKAAVVNARSKADITVKVNGKAVTNFNYNKTNKLLSFKSALKAGSNAVQITVNNGKGNANQTFTITRR